MANPAGSFIWYELMTPDPDSIAPSKGRVDDDPLMRAIAAAGVLANADAAPLSTSSISSRVSR
jgi:hypothetical protein